MLVDIPAQPYTLIRLWFILIRYRMKPYSDYSYAHVLLDSYSPCRPIHSILNVDIYYKTF